MEKLSIEHLPIRINNHFLAKFKNLIINCLLFLLTIYLQIWLGRRLRFVNNAEHSFRTSKFIRNKCGSDWVLLWFFFLSSLFFFKTEGLYFLLLLLKLLFLRVIYLKFSNRTLALTTIERAFTFCNVFLLLCYYF